MMKTLTIFFLLTLQLYSQSYMNVMYNDSTYKYSIINDISKITFNAGVTDMTVTNTNTPSSTDQLSNIAKMTFDDTISGGGSPLPVELVRFTGELSDVGVRLLWATATEVENYGFQVQREKLKDQSEWEDLGFVEGHGNSNSPKEYSFIDNESLSGTIQYRLKQIDRDGSYKYFPNNIGIAVETDTPKEFKLFQNYPNPFNPSTTIAYQIPKEGFVTLKVYDVLGREIMTLVNENKQVGKYYVEFIANQLPSGAYFYRLNYGEFTQIIKMLLLK